MARHHSSVSGLAAFGGVYAAAGFALLSVLDMGLSSIAFVLGIPEANPLLSWLASHGLFEPAKLALTALVAVLIARTYSQPYVRHFAWSAVAVMVAVLIYHVCGLNAIGLGRGLRASGPG